jgi:Putative transposase/Transposase zinc-binding domain
MRGTLGSTPRRQRHEPEHTVLYQVLQEHLETFLARIDEDGSGRCLPRFVVRELHDYLKCGILAHGFCRVFCERCNRSELVAFSCKHRGFCPSCGARRMADLAAHLVDTVFPEVPVRQWVLSLPHPIRYLCAYDPECCAAVRRVLARAVSGFYQSRARRLGLPRPQPGAVVFEQRFDSGLRLNLHFHGLWMDGVFARVPGSGCMCFHPHPDLTDEEVARLVRRIRNRVLRALHKRGKLPDDDTDAPTDGSDPDPDLLQDLCAAAVQGRTATGRRRGRSDPRLGRGTEDQPFLKGRLCCDLDGFSLHAAVRIPGGLVDRLEQLCRYAARPPIVLDRLTRTGDGTLLYKLKRRYRDGSTHVVFTPHTLIERLCALIPRPRKKLVTYHGVLAPAAGLRDRVVPDPLERSGEDRDPEPPDDAIRRLGIGARPRAPVPHVPSRLRGPRKAYTWAELLRRVFLVNVLTCPHCGGPRRLLAAVFDPQAIESILRCLSLPTQAPVIAAARPPPQLRLPW